MPIEHRGQPERLVGSRQLPRFRRGSRFFPAVERPSPAPFHGAIRAAFRSDSTLLPDRREGLAEEGRSSDHTPSTRRGRPASARVIAILLPPLRIAAGRLKMAVGPRRDPDIGPRRRNHQRGDPLERGLIADRLVPRGSTYRNPLPDFRRRIPGRQSLIYFKPAAYQRSIWAGSIVSSGEQLAPGGVGLAWS